MKTLFEYCKVSLLSGQSHVRWSRSLVRGWKARGKDIKKIVEGSVTMIVRDDRSSGIIGRYIALHAFPNFFVNYRSSAVQSLAAHAGSGVSYSQPGPQ